MTRNAPVFQKIIALFLWAIPLQTQGAESFANAPDCAPRVTESQTSHRHDWMKYGYYGLNLPTAPVTPAVAASAPTPAPAPVPVAAPSAPSPVPPVPIMYDDTRYRIEAGIGYGLGRYTGTLGDMSPRVDIDSYIGVKGTVGHVGLWDDALLGHDLALGFEYVGMNTDAAVSATVTSGFIDGIDDALSAEATARLKADLFFMNIAYQYPNGGKVTPFIGGGVGVGHANLTTSYHIGDVISDDAEKNFSSWVGGVQAFAGVNIDLTENLYLTPKIRAFYFTARPLGYPHEYLQTDVEIGLGYKF